MSFNYPSQTYFKGIQNISFSVSKGEVLAIVGKSGSGKTTALKCIYGLEDIHQGEILLNDERVFGPAYNLIPGHEQMKLVSQDFYVLDNHTVEENVFDKLIGFALEARQKRTDKILKLVELYALRHTKARHLSAGQKQRVAIARALAIIPDVLLLDEPFSNLDKLLTEKLYAFIVNEVKRKHTSVILITHLAEEALKYADSIVVLDQGRIIQAGKKWDVYYHPKNTKLAGLLGDYTVLKPVDFEKKSAFKPKSKLFVRPDKITPLPSAAGAHLYLEVLNCSFNGKCFEILAETPGGTTVMIYSGKKFVTGKSCYFKINL